MKRKLSLLLIYSLLASMITLPASADSRALYEIEVFDLRKQGDVSGESKIFQSQGYLRSFSVYADGQPAGHPVFSISADGKTYKAITPDIHEEDGRSPGVVYQSRGFPGKTKYVKITFKGSGAAPLPPTGKVVLNGPTSVGSGVPSGEVPYGRMVMLNKAALGDTVYYTTDGSDPRTSRTRMHYSSPIPVLNELLLKVTAVNHSGSGRSAASRVSTYRYTPSPAASPSPSSGMTDTLDNFKRLAGRSNVYITKVKPGYFDNDGSRMTRTTRAPGYLTYHTDYDITSVTVHAGFFTGNQDEKLRFSVSADGKQYQATDAEAYPVAYPEGNWQQYAYEVRGLPENTRYLKIELLGEDKAWSPQLMRVVINRDTASVKLNSSRSEEAVNAELSSESKDARIYYRLNKGADFVPYSEPLRLQGYNVLETYAVTDGREPSPIRRYSVNASSDIQVDRFGQMMNKNFTGKVKSEAELESDAKADDDYYGNLKPPEDRDPYGGLAGSAEKHGMKATGFFSIQELNGRKVMTTPEGNVYFSLGVNGITAQETYTMVKGREEKFESVPAYQGEYKRAFVGKDNFSFYLANKYRKTGKFPTDHAIYSEAVTRLRKWGFNGVGGYSPEKYGKDSQFPYVRMLPLNSMDWAKLEGISIFDIFAPDAEAKIDKAFDKALTPHKDDKMLLGYYIDNEYDFHKFYSHVPKLKASSAAIKGKLVELLQNKYQDIDAFNKSWGTSFKSFEDLKEAELPLRTSPAWRDMESFFDYYLDTFIGTVSRIYRKYDPNHLLIGDRWITTPFHNKKFREVLAKTEGRYVDVISINYYTYKIETDLLQEVHEKSGGKPILISEFGYGTADQGLDPLLINSAANQFERGMRYRNFVEGVASLPYIVGAHTFNYVDQAGLGRYFGGHWGERYNSGLVNVTDRPYKDYLEGIMDTNYEIYKVILGERRKFYYDFSKK